MELLVTTAVWIFILTHIDTLVVLTAFCTDANYKLPELIVGHYIGFTVGLLVAITGAIIATDLFQESAFLLGLVPLGLGIWGLSRQGPDHSSESSPAAPPTRSGRATVVVIAGVGLSGENIAVFVPFFATLSTSELLSIFVLYLVAAGFVFLLALFLGRRAHESKLPNWVEELLVPGSLITVGLYVLLAGWLAG